VLLDVELAALPGGRRQGCAQGRCEPLVGVEVTSNYRSSQVGTGICTTVDTVGVRSQSSPVTRVAGQNTVHHRLALSTAPPPTPRESVSDPVR
jgi:hypothetical protein